jgi:hypothetical protein
LGEEENRRGFGLKRLSLRGRVKLLLCFFKHHFNS